MDWVILIASGVLEAVWATALGLSNGFKKLVPTIIFVIAAIGSLGGLGILVIHLQNTRGWRAGKLQMAADILILCGAFLMRDLSSVLLSILGAIALNLVIAVNHKSGRYMGM